MITQYLLPDSAEQAVAELAPGAAVMGGGTTVMPAGNSGGMDESVAGKVASSPIRVPAPTASSIIASFGLSTGIGARAAAQASMQGPKAEQVNRMPSAPVPAA